MIGTGVKRRGKSKKKKKVRKEEETETYQANYLPYISNNIASNGMRKEY